MKDAARRANFVAYFEHALKGDRERLEQKSGLSKGRISQLFDPKQAFGERAAENLAIRLGLGANHFEQAQAHVVDQPHTPAPPPVVVDLAQVLEALGTELAAADMAMREALATNLAGWARDGGKGPWQQVVLHLLQTPPEKRQSNGR